MPKKTTLKSTKPKHAGAKTAKSTGTSTEVEKRIADIGGWKSEKLAVAREVIRDAVPNVIEELKWKKPSNNMTGIPVWSFDGIICTGETYKDKVKLTFAQGASLEDPAMLFNASLDGKTRRAIDLYEGDAIKKRAFKVLVRSAADFNASKKRKSQRGELT